MSEKPLPHQNLEELLMPIKVHGESNPKPIATDEKKIIEFMDSLAKSYRDFLRWLFDFNKEILFHDVKDNKNNSLSCKFGVFLNSSIANNFMHVYELKKLKAAHNEVHILAESMLEDLENKHLMQGQYETLKRSVIKLTLRVDQLRQLSAFSIAHTDSLTGQLSREVMESYLKREVARADREDGEFCVAMLDIDFFKRVNDSYGHHVGDDVLTWFAETVSTNLRVYDDLFRYGGEEFLALLPAINLKNAYAVLDRIREKIEENVIESQGNRIHITVSGGIAAYKRGATIENVLKTADDMLYKAKKGGRNRICYQD
ncbi:GGDEF domain-containing protein [Magnetococcales bacterium HHB-1]